MPGGVRGGQRATLLVHEREQPLQDVARGSPSCSNSFVTSTCTFPTLDAVSSERCASTNMSS